MTVTVRTVVGSDAAPHLDDLARLRIQVFRDWPYLYDGTPDYERQYLEAYTRAPSVLLILAEDGGRVVGASSAMRMSDEAEVMRAPLEASGIDPSSVCYFGESVLDPAYRGFGLGKRFIEERLTHARTLSARQCCFAAVVRDADDQRRPTNAQNLEPLWRRYGFAPAAGLQLSLDWPELGRGEISHRLQFWFRDC